MTTAIFIDADNGYPAGPGDPPEAPRRLLRRAWPHVRAAFAEPETISEQIVDARVEHGRWLVDCPFCRGAQYASQAFPRFFCVDCLHEGTEAERRWLRVAWPRNRDAIETELARRADVRTRNWARPETIENLRSETRAAATIRAAIAQAPELLEPGADGGKLLGPEMTGKLLEEGTR